MANRQIDGAFIDIFSFDESESIDLILYARDRNKTIGFSIYGTYEQCINFQDTAKRGKKLWNIIGNCQKMRTMNRFCILWRICSSFFSI